MRTVRWLGSAGSPLYFFQSRRSMWNMPSGVETVLQYSQTCNLTKSIQFVVEGLHDIGLPWAGAIVLSGIALRLVTAPVQIYSEKLMARSSLATNFIGHEILKKISKHYKVDILVSSDGKRLQLDTTDKLIHQKSRTLIGEYTSKYLMENGLQNSRIFNLKMCVIPVWIFSSFALRNVFQSERRIGMDGLLWFPDLIDPDPLFLLPIAVSVLSFFNLWSRHQLYPVQSKKLAFRIHTTLLTIVTLGFTVLMLKLPACFPLYWLIISSTATAENLLLRHPGVKGFFGIPPLPTDSRTPLRDLFLRKRGPKVNAT